MSEIQTYTPSNGAMLVCSSGGDYIKTKDHLATIARLEAEIAALRAELADLKDGLTAAHMDGFASGKAEATEMLRKREGQLEELRAEVKAYREVEDSLQKEIKRLDEEVERLRNEGGTMRVINQSGGKPPSSVCSAPAEGARSNVFPMYPCWPPAELPLHVRVLPQVGGPHPSVHDSEDDY